VLNLPAGFDTMPSCDVVTFEVRHSPRLESAARLDILEQHESTAQEDFRL
jgi:hypothetical protein